MLRQECRSVLAVVAHPDDAEYLFGGVVAKLVDSAAEANYVVCPMASGVGGTRT